MPRILLNQTPNQYKIEIIFNPNVYIYNRNGSQTSTLAGNYQVSDYWCNSLASLLLKSDDSYMRQVTMDTFPKEFPEKKALYFD